MKDVRLECDGLRIPAVRVYSETEVKEELQRTKTKRHQSHQTMKQYRDQSQVTCARYCSPKLKSDFNKIHHLIHELINMQKLSIILSFSRSERFEMFNKNLSQVMQENDDDLDGGVAIAFDECLYCFYEHLPTNLWYRLDLSDMYVVDSLT